MLINDDEFKFFSNFQKIINIFPFLCTINLFIEKIKNQYFLGVTNLVYFLYTKTWIYSSKTEKTLYEKLLTVFQKLHTSGQFLAQTLGFTDEFLGIPRIFRYVTNLNETVNIFKLNRF